LIEAGLLKLFNAAQLMSWLRVKLEAARENAWGPISAKLIITK